MNVEEAMRRLKDPSEWKLRFDAPGLPAPRRSPRVPARFAAAAVVTGLAVIASVAAVALNTTSTPSPPVPPPAAEQVATPDDGMVTAQKYSSMATTDTMDKVESLVRTAGNDSIPWAVMYAFNDSEGVFIAYVAGGPDCGDHLGVDVVETNTTITIAALNSPTDAAAGRACKLDPSIAVGMVNLKEPLGTRTLIHAALTSPWTAADRPIDTVPGHDREEPQLPVAEMPAYAGSATCENLLSNSSRRAFERKGWFDAGPRYTDKIRDEAESDPLLYAFLDYGGIVCAVGNGSLSAVSYGYGPITTAQEEKQRKDLRKNGWELTHDEGFDVYVQDRTDFPDADDLALAFGDGVWAFTRDFDAGRHIIDDILEHRPSND